MLVAEVRAALKKYNEDELQRLVVEMYKAMPKKLREDKGIDDLVQDLASNLDSRRGKKADPVIDLSSLRSEIDQFISDAYDGYYMSPNNVIRKKDRPKWRFKVGGYIKDLQTVPAYGELGILATDLLENLYKMLTYCCSYYIFNTQNPFRSVAVEQTDLLDIVISRRLAPGLDAEVMKAMIILVISSALDMQTLSTHLIWILVKNLRTVDAKALALEQAILTQSELKEAKPKKTKKNWDIGNALYSWERKMENLTELVFRLLVLLSEPERAIAYFLRNEQNQDDEVALFILLNLLWEYDLMEEWIQEYERMVAKGVKPRDGLKRGYNHIREHGKLPEFIW